MNVVKNKYVIFQLLKGYTQTYISRMEKHNQFRFSSIKRKKELRFDAFNM